MTTPNNPNQAAQDFTALIAQLEAGKGKKKQKNTATKAAYDAMSATQKAIVDQKAGKAPSAEVVKDVCGEKGTAEARAILFANPKCSNSLLKQQLFLRTSEGEKSSVRSILLNPNLKGDAVRDWYAANKLLPFAQAMLKDEAVMSSVSAKILAS